MRDKIVSIQALLAAAKEENEFGGGEDADGCLHPGDVNWDELEERIICILEDREWTPPAAPQPRPVIRVERDIEFFDLSTMPLKED